MTDEPVVLDGRYQLEEVIGRGGMAEVWRARDLRLDRLVAVKRLRVDLATDSTFQARFAREAQSAAGLNHPNIVSVYDTGEKIDPATGVSVPFIVMELVEGHTLRQILRQGRTIQPEKAFEYTIGVLEALSYSHKHDIVHRDIKPANVMITPSGRVKVMDFGIARAVSDTAATMTQTAAVIGTAQYLSPEQARGEQVDARSDIYSAGCLLYELLTGRPPFVGDSPVSVAYQHVREMPIPPSQLDPEITPEMDAITLKALAKSTEDRYQSAKDMRDDCWRMLNDQPVTARIPAVVAVSDPRPETAATRALPAELDPDADVEHDTFYVEEEPKDPSTSRRVSPATLVLISLIVLLLAALGLFAWRLMAPDPADNNVQVPQVVGFQEEAAQEQLTLAQLNPRVLRVAGPAEGKGTVIDQDPDGNTIVLVGSTVTITINDGPPVSTIPQGLVSKQQEEAIALLKQAGFTKIEPLPAPADLDTLNAKPGQVVRVVPEQGTQVSTDQQVTLYVATGRTTMPNVVGLARTTALQSLADAGYLNVSVTELSYAEGPSDAVADSVVRTSPEAEQAVSKTDRIVLYVATREAAVPDVSGLSPQAAIDALELSGFRNVQQDGTIEAPTADLVGKVVRTVPAPGTSAVVDDPITLMIGVASSQPTTAPPGTTGPPATPPGQTNPNVTP